MPTYEYKCPNGHRFEKFSPQMTDKRRERCPKCGEPAERQISGGAGLVFKGSGFYVTDYKRAGEKKPEEKVEKKAGEKQPEKQPETKKDSTDK